MDLQDNQLLSMTQAAGLLGFTATRFGYYLRRPEDRPPHTVQGGRKLFDPEALLDWKAGLADRRRFNKGRKGGV